VILLDSDVLMIELRYPYDRKASRNRLALQTIQADGIALGVTAQVLLEVVGNLSFNTSRAQVSRLPHTIITSYNLTVLPNLSTNPDYAGCTVAELITQMSQQMSLADAVQAVQIAHHAPTAICLLTWNARHFVGKLVISALTPDEWLNQRAGKTP
jgi:hypothetical protein